MGLAVASVALEERERQPAAVRMITQHPGVAWAAALLTFIVLSTQLGLERRGPPVHMSFAQWALEHVLYGLVALFVLLPAIFGDSAGGAVRRVLGNRVLAWLGLVSYGIFLWNLAVVTVLSDHGVGDWIPSLRFPVLEATTIVVTAAIAAASYYVVERPILRFKDRRPRRSRAAPPAPIAAAGASRDAGPGGG
jgi:peptidoglycan/LPS O-acetylase OafA/YrhL